MVQIGVCDDVPEDGKQVEKALAEYMEIKHCPYSCRIYQCSKSFWYEVEDGTKFDLLFLDIEMSELSGFELAERLRVLLPEALIVFISSYERYVYDSFQFQPYRFIPKSRLLQMLFPVLEDALKEITRKEGFVLLAENQQGIEKIAVKNIVYIWHEGKYVYIVKTDGQQSKVRKTLKQIYEGLPVGEFIWIDRGYICNLAHVRQIKENKLTLSTGIELYASQGRLAEVKKQVMEYWIRENTV